MKILIVCTGNTCRSPLAEAMLRRKLAERGRADIVVSSAGTGAWEGAPASEGSYLVALEGGLDLSGHSARLLTQPMIDAADLVLAMAPAHVARIESLGGEGRTWLVGEYVGRSGTEAEVDDPFGASLEAYRDTFAQLDDLLGDVADRVVSADQPDAET